MERLLTPEEVAERLRLSVITVKKWLRQGKLQGVKVGKLWRVPEEEVKKVMCNEK